MSDPSSGHHVPYNAVIHPKYSLLLPITVNWPTLLFKKLKPNKLVHCRLFVVYCAVLFHNQTRHLYIGLTVINALNAPHYYKKIN
jgi:hypothetical protein